MNTPRTQMDTLIAAVARSRINYRLSYLVDLACPIVLGVLGVRQSTGWLVLIASIGVGFVTFSFVEYAIHRWLFHASSGVMAAMHQRHHDAPEEPAALPCLTSAGVAVLLWPVLAACANAAVASGFLCGLMCGYFWYGALHHLEHHVRQRSAPGRWLQRRWAMHAVHHRLVDANYGVTSSLWDRVLGTHYRAHRDAPGAVRRGEPTLAAGDASGVD